MTDVNSIASALRSSVTRPPSGSYFVITGARGDSEEHGRATRWLVAWADDGSVTLTSNLDPARQFSETFAACTPQERTLDMLVRAHAISTSEQAGLLTAGKPGGTEPVA